MVFGSAAIKGTFVVGGDGYLRYPIPSGWTFIFILPVFAAFLMVCVHLWSTKVEPLFAKATKALEDFATGKGTRNGQNSPLVRPELGKRTVSYPS